MRCFKGGFLGKTNEGKKVEKTKKRSLLPFLFLCVKIYLPVSRIYGFLLSCILKYADACAEQIYRGVNGALYAWRERNLSPGKENNPGLLSPGFSFIKKRKQNAF